MDQPELPPEFEVKPRLTPLAFAVRFPFGFALGFWIGARCRLPVWGMLILGGAFGLAVGFAEKIPEVSTRTRAIAGFVLGFAAMLWLGESLKWAITIGCFAAILAAYFSDRLWGID